MNDDGYFDEAAAERYDEFSGSMFDPEKVDPVVDFLADLAEGGSLLELGVGTGRIALPLVRRGLEVDGIDMSVAMTDRLRSKGDGDKVGITIGDFASFSTGKKYSVAYLVFNTIMNLTTQEAQVACFQNVANHLEPGGLFVIEVSIPKLQRLPVGETIRPYKMTDSRMSFDEYSVADQGLISHHFTLTDGIWDRMSIPFRYVWPDELNLMARLAGMSLYGRWSGWKQEPFTNDSETLVAVWQKP